MESVQASIDINAPIWRVYQNWKQLERFPEFVETVIEARWTAKDKLHWREVCEGTEYTFLYEVTMRLAESSVAWRSISGPENRGTARCDPLPGGRTRITLTTQYAPEATQTASVVRNRLDEYLHGFARFVHGQGQKQTGAK